MEDVKESIASELKKEGRFLDSWLKDNSGKGTKDTYINFKDEPNRGVVLNTYPQRKYVIQNNQHDAERTRQTEKHDLFCSDEWWEEQQRFINDSLYINHDWEIFKDEGERK